MKTRLPLALVVAMASALVGPLAQAEEPASPFTARAAEAQAASGWNVEFRHWKQGDPDLKLIRREEGVCALAGVTGHFEGDGEQVHVYIGNDGYWYLGGSSYQQGVAADCVIVRFPVAPPAPPAPLAVAPTVPVNPAPVEPVKILAASYSFGSHYSDVTERVRTLISRGDTVYASPDCLGTDPQPGWNKALVVFCEVQGKLSLVSVGEGETISKDSVLKDARPVTP